MADAKNAGFPAEAVTRTVNINSGQHYRALLLTPFTGLSPPGQSSTSWHSKPTPQRRNLLAYAPSQYWNVLQTSCGLVHTREWTQNQRIVTVSTNMTDDTTTQMTRVIEYPGLAELIEYLFST